MMRDIVKELNEVNKTYIFGEDTCTKISKLYNQELKNSLNKLQQYELILNEAYLPILSEDKLLNSIIDWPDIIKYGLSNNEAIEYFKNRSSMKDITLDRKYFFYELILNFCEKKDKRAQANDTIKILKLLIHNKIKNSSNFKIFTILYLRFIILSSKYKLVDDVFIISMNKEYLGMIKYNKEGFYSSILFFRAFFNKYNNKTPYYNEILDLFNIIIERMEQQFLKTPKPEFSALIGDIYKRINDVEKRDFFYKKEIDDFFKINENATVQNRMRFQLGYFPDKMNLSRDIKYRFDELKKLSIKNSNEIINNKDELFSMDRDSEMEEYLYKILEKVKISYEKEKDKNKLDYLIFCIFHEAYNIEQLNESNINKEGVSSIYLNTLSKISYKGQINKTKDINLNFFFMTIHYTITLFLNLDNEVNWVRKTKNKILQDLKRINLLDEHKEQYKISIKHFSNQNYMEFMYMAPALIENILKKYLIQIEGDVISYRAGHFTDKTLNQVMEELQKDSKCYMDKSILKLISYILIDSDGMNLRNEILHGNFKDKDFNKQNAMFIYIILIYLIRYFYYDEKI